MTDAGTIIHRLNKISTRAVYFIFFLICLTLYFKCLTNGYSLDDDYLLSDKSVQKGISATKEIFGSRYINYYHAKHEYRPLTKFVFALEYQLFGLKAGTAHFVNILFYFLVSTFFFNLLLRLRFVPGKAFAFICSLVFILHPLHTEAVCSIKNLDVLLSGMFSLLSCVYVLKYFERKKILFFLLAIGFLFCGMLSKLDSLPFFAIIPALIWLQYPKKIKLAIGSVFFLALFYILFVFIRRWALSDEDDAMGRTLLYHENPLVELKGFKFKLLALFSSFGVYIEKLFLGGPLICYYGYKTISMDEPFTQRHIFIGLFAVISLLTLVWIKRKNTLVIFGALTIVAPLSMYLNFPKIAPGIIADRFAFISVIGFSLLLTYALFSLTGSTKIPSAKKWITVPLALILCYFSVKTIQRTFDWEDRLILIERDIKKVPESAMMHFLKGSFLLNEAKGKFGAEQKTLLDSSESSFKKSLRIFERNGSAWNNIGGIYFYHRKDFAKAYPNFKRAYELDQQNDNKILYAKSMFLSGNKNEFYAFAAKEINAGSGKDMKDFVAEFPRFLKKEQLTEAYLGLSAAGINDHAYVVKFAKGLLDKGYKTEAVNVIYNTFKNGNRDKKLAEQTAEFFYDNDEVEKASFLMDIVEGKVK